MKKIRKFQKFNKTDASLGKTQLKISNMEVKVTVQNYTVYHYLIEVHGTQVKTSIFTELGLIQE